MYWMSQGKMLLYPFRTRISPEKTSQPALLMICLLFAGATFGAECGERLAQIVSLQGQVEVKRANSARWLQVKTNDSFCAADTIRVDRYARAAIRFSNHTLLRLDGGTTLSLPGEANSKTTLLDLLRGALHIISRTTGRLEIRTPFDNAAIDGTELVVSVTATESSTWVMEGRIQVTNSLGSVQLTEGKASFTLKESSPQPRLLIRPKDAVQWALYYPPLVSLNSSSYPKLAAINGFQQALQLYAEGDIRSALTGLDRITETYRNAQYFNVRAAMLLSIGQLDEAQQNIKRSIQITPDGGVAVALKSIIFLAQNKQKEAFYKAQLAVDLESQSPIVHIAMSYIYQARFQIEQALESAQHATDIDPNSALAKARLAELWLMLGEIERSFAVAHQAVDIEPGLARIQIVLGFANLARSRTDTARQAFNKAIELDQAAPLPHLGLGLAMIRDGELTTGRKQIELAVLLDPLNSLLRSYLGKAYYEEKRNDQAAVQFQLSKQLDPNDPTPWLYDAIRKLAQNRPVEAARDLNSSIELNDNRAVYRSRLLLDEDLATRGSSVARIYHNLGYEQVALLEGWRSLQKYPANHSAHRLLADTYPELPGHEMARVSELLQSLLLQPLNTRPYQPSLGEEKFWNTDNTTLTPGYSEYSNLFMRNGMHFNINGLYGSNNTKGGELVAGGVHNQIAYSIGAMEYQSDGVRVNSGQHLELKNAFLQYRITPSLSLQLEARKRHAEYGDIEMRFDDSHKQDFNREITTDTIRAGLLTKLNQHSNLLFSLSRQWEVDQEIDIESEVTASISRSSDTEFRGNMFETQYLTTGRKFNLTAGAGIFSQNYSVSKEESVTYSGLGIFESPQQKREHDIEHNNAYIYLNWGVDASRNLMLGASYDDFSSDLLGNYQNLNPKLGLSWNIGNHLLLRMAGYRQFRRSPFRIPSLEPTQIMGFNQLHDNYAATDTRSIATAIDYRLPPYLFSGIEFTRKTRDIPVYKQEADATYLINQREWLMQVYLNWTPSHNTAFSSEFTVDKFAVTGAEDIWEVDEVNESRLSLTLKHYATSRLYSSIAATSVNQSVTANNKEEFDTSFSVVDIGLGYRIAAFSGNFGITLKNLLDEKFSYQDRNFYTNEPILSSFIPERVIVVYLSMYF